MTQAEELKELRRRFDRQAEEALNDFWWNFDISKDSLTAQDRDDLEAVKATLCRIAERAYQVEHSL